MESMMWDQYLKILKSVKKKKNPFKLRNSEELPQTDIMLHAENNVAAQHAKP